MEHNGQFVKLDHARAQMMPVRAGQVPDMTFWVDSDDDGELDITLMASSDPAVFTPDRKIASQRVSLASAASRVGHVTTVSRPQFESVQSRKSKDVDILAHKRKSYITDVFPQRIHFRPDVKVDRDQFLMLVLQAAPGVRVAISDERPCGLLALTQRGNGSVSKADVQVPPDQSGIDTFPFWLPERRPGGKNFAMQFNPALCCFDAANVAHGPERPTTQTNAWSASLQDTQPWIELSWAEPKTLGRIDIAFDTDLDHPMESVLMGHPERVMPNCVREAIVYDENNRVLGELTNNHQTRWSLRMQEPVVTKHIRIVAKPPAGDVPPLIFRIRCFSA